MDFKNTIIILAIIVFFSSVIVVSAESNQQNVHDMQTILENYNESDMTGMLFCCIAVRWKQ